MMYFIFGFGIGAFIFSLIFYVFGIKKSHARGTLEIFEKNKGTDENLSMLYRFVIDDLSDLDNKRYMILKIERK